VATGNVVICEIPPGVQYVPVRGTVRAQTYLARLT